MNFEETHRTIGLGAIVCVFGLLLNLAMLKKRGRSAALLAGSFSVFGIMLLLSYLSAPLVFIYPLGAVVLGLLLYDASLRIKKAGERP